MVWLSAAYYGAKAFSIVSSKLSSSTWFWMPTTVATLKLDFNSLTIIFLLLILFVSCVYAMFKLCQIVAHTITQVFTTVLSTGTSNSVILASLVFLMVLAVFCPVISFLMYAANRLRVDICNACFYVLKATGFIK